MFWPLSVDFATLLRPDIFPFATNLCAVAAAAADGLWGVESVAAAADPLETTLVGLCAFVGADAGHA